MQMTSKRVSKPTLSATGERVLAQYKQQLRVEEDLAHTTIRNYLSDLRHFAAWCESTWKQEREEEASFVLGTITTLTLTNYQTYLQQELHLKPNSVNSCLKRHFVWLLHTGQVRHNPAKVVKLLGEETIFPRLLDAQEEQDLVKAVTKKGDVRDQAIIILMLHTGLRVRELCTVTRNQIRLSKRSRTITVRRKHNKYREIPLNATARTVLLVYDSSLLKLSHDPTPLFLSEKRHTQLTERGLGYLIKKYAERAHVSDVSLHDLRHRFGYRMAEVVPLHRLAQIMGHDALDTTLLYIRRTKQDLQQDVEKIAWI